MTALPEAMRLALDHVEDAVVITSVHDGPRIVYVNAAFTRASSYSSEEAVGRTLADLQGTRSAGPEGNGAAVAVRRKDGSEYRVRKEIAAPLGEGTASYVVEIQRADDARHRLIAEHSRDMISTLGADGVCTYISPSCRDVIGFEPEEVIGARDFQLAHPEDLIKNRAGFARALERGALENPSVTTRVRHKNGSYVWLESSSSVIRDAQGRVLEIQSAGRDVTARVMAEEALAHSEENLRVLLEQLPDAVALHRDGTLVFANPPFARMLGYGSAGDLIGKPVLDLVHASERAQVSERLRTHDRTLTRSNERLALCANGQSITVQISALPILFQGQLAILVVMQDLTDRKKLEAQLAVADRLASVGRLAVAVGHEINNPLSYVLASIELMRAELPVLARESPHPLLASFAESAGMVQEGAERVRDIVHDLRTLSSVGTGPIVAVDIHRVLDIAAATANHEIRLRARLTKHYGRARMVLADERRLVQVFVNVLINAAQATPAGDVEQNEIRITTRASGTSLIVEIRDTGMGLPEGDVSRIFEPFFTTKPDGVGTGLGLSVSHQIVSAFGGAMTAEPCTPRGTLLRVSLPASADAPANESAAEAVAADALPRMRILVVDDEPQIVRVLTMLLATHEVVTASGGREAKALLHAGAWFDVILCDLQMSDGTAADIYQHVKATIPTLERRMILMTGGAFTEPARAFLASCPQPCIEKPFLPSALVALISLVNGAS